MRQAADPRDCPFNTDAETGVRYAAEFAQLQVPGISITRKANRRDAFLDQLFIPDAFAAAGDFAITLRSQHIDAPADFRTTIDWLHIKRFDGGRIVINEHGLLE